MFLNAGRETRFHPLGTEKLEVADDDHGNRSDNDNDITRINYNAIKYNNEGDVTPEFRKKRCSDQNTA